MFIYMYDVCAGNDKDWELKGMDTCWYIFVSLVLIKLLPWGLGFRKA